MSIVERKDFAHELGFGVGERFDHVQSVVGVEKELKKVCVDRLRGITQGYDETVQRFATITTIIHKRAHYLTCPLRALLANS